MHITQFAHMSGTPVSFKSGDPIIGNCAHLEQTLYIAVATGLLEGHFQQRMVRNPVGQMEPLSPEIQMNEDGKVETVYSSSLEIQTFQAGSLIEVRPGCAYAFKALSDGMYIEYLMPDSIGQSLFKEMVGQVSVQPFPDAITFELLKHSGVKETETVLQTDAAQSQEPLPQRYFYREEGTGILLIMFSCFGLMLLLGILFSSQNPLMIMLLIAAILYVGYWSVLLGIQLYKKPFTLGVEEDGLIINNLTFNELFIKWEDIDRIQMGAINRGRYESQGELVIEVIPKDPDAYGKFLNPLSRLWFNYCANHDTDFSMPTIIIKQSLVTVDLNDLLPQLITKKLSYNYTKIAPQENA